MNKHLPPFVLVKKHELAEFSTKIHELPSLPPDLFHQARRHEAQAFMSPKNYDPKTNELLLYHGTNVEGLENMLKEGVKVAKGYGVLGAGLYVSPSANEALKWSRRGGQRVVIEFAVRDGDKAKICCVYRNPNFQKKCADHCELYTAYDTVMMHKYKGGYYPHFWQYLIKDQSLFDRSRIYIKRVFLLTKKQQQTGGAAPTVAGVGAEN